MYQNPVSRVHNIILGQMWIEHWGEISCKNFRTGDVCEIHFTKSGLFQGAQVAIAGKIYDSKGTVLYVPSFVRNLFL